MYGLLICPGQICRTGENKSTRFALKIQGQTYQIEFLFCGHSQAESTNFAAFIAL